ncbi:N-6 DNA methylase [Paenibacillus sp. ACRRY]|uniref:HsdM family class I SAM-dependent methyltransferase n=1 Tax=Paenibacillus sp. ACRRY TaxID=2918208 RepID=UPI001EF584B8|nr:N-6 DNA methylase [Paenibacillus sp. ACRRY]MCG7383384.1 SAM-dependent methyltransferase [Paenibacillus sp. ACRRY]
MGKADRKRWDGNVKSMAIVAKPRDEITEEDVAFLRENYTSTGGLLPNAYAGGAFYTPTHVARFVIDALRGLSGGEFAPGSRFLEPSAGSGVFIEHMPQDAEITALELDETSAKVTSLIYPHANVIQGDAFRHVLRDYYDYVIGNPPYGVSIDIAAEDLPDEYETLRITKGRAKGKSESAFIELAIKAAKPGGYIAFVLPKGIGQTSLMVKIRELMRETCWHIASIELPGTTFALTGTSIPTDIHILRKTTPNTRKVYVKYSQIGSSRCPLDIVKQAEEGVSDTFWFEGQMPVLQAQINDIGYDKDGNSTDKWGDGQTQLDELIEAFENTLMRENTDPVGPFDGIEKSADLFHAFNVKIPEHEKWNEKVGNMAYWNVLTLGRGGEINGESSFDFTWQDRIVAEYYARETEITPPLAA